MPKKIRQTASPHTVRYQRKAGTIILSDSTNQFNTKRITVRNRKIVTKK